MEKESKKMFYLKLFVSALFAGLVFGAFAYVLINKADITAGGAHNILTFAAVGACLVFSALFLRKSAKKILVSIALAIYVAANYFLLLNPTFENASLIGWGLLCGVQFCFFVYTLTLCKGIGLKIVNISVRVALCLVAWFVLPKVLTVTLTATGWIQLMYVINSAVTLLCLLFSLKRNWLLFLGLLALLAFDIFTMFAGGWMLILQMSGAFVDFMIKNPNFAYYFFLPALYLIALSSVWEKKKE